VITGFSEMTTQKDAEVLREIRRIAGFAMTFEHEFWCHMHAQLYPTRAAHWHFEYGEPPVLGRWTQTSKLYHPGTLVSADEARLVDRWSDDNQQLRSHLFYIGLPGIRDAADMNLPKKGDAPLTINSAPEQWRDLNLESNYPCTVSTADQERGAFGVMTDVANRLQQGHCQWPKESGAAKFVVTAKTPAR